MKIYIKVDNIWFRSGELIKREGKLAFMVYMLIMERMSGDRFSHITLSYIIAQLGVDAENRHFTSTIKSAITTLIDYDFISLRTNRYDETPIDIKDITIRKNTDLYFTCNPPKNDYTCIYSYELLKILSADVSNKSKVGLLAQFCYIISCINTKELVSYPSISNIKKYAKIGSDKLCIEYNKLLVALNVLVIGNPDMSYKNASGRLVVTSNYYARPDDVDKLDAMVEAKAKQFSKACMTKATKAISHRRRVLSAKINHIEDMSLNRKLTEEELEAYNEYVEEYEQLCASHKTDNSKPNKLELPKPVKINLEGYGEVNFNLGSGEREATLIPKTFNVFDDSNDISHLIK